ncbi:MAG TPA: hypothetical protein DCZ94_21800 [Lentisphaeria bacterium]|nr:MAG: hypothetical protein A2X48_19355 [Lentisphaerae bacterium GWF2_49_21]HBC89581.1 hypothetical protein [Lentisphaeria bacterium]
METLGLFYYSAQAIFTIVLMSIGGVILAKFKILDSSSLQTLSKVIFHLLLPCMLFASFTEKINFAKLMELWVLPVTGVIFIVTGLALGTLAVRMIRISPEYKSVVTATCGFGNAMYLPFPLVIAICTIFPEFNKEPELQAMGIIYVSMFVIAFSPMMWTVGYNILGEKSHSSLKVSDFITPPVWGIIAGLIAASIPSITLSSGNVFSLRAALCDSSGFLHPVFTTCVSLGNAVVPCAMIVLGGSFALSPLAKHLDFRPAVIVIAVKLIILPVLAIAYIKTLMHFNLIPHGKAQDTLLALVMLIQSAVPPATSLIVISSLQKKNVDEMGSLLLWLYLTSLLTLTIFIVIGMRIFQ